MANQPKKYKKFVATAATATLVASAIVPVASAASFSDVSENNEFAPYIDALTEAGIINGYPSTNTFKPGAALTRGQVVKMLGRWVESNGVEIPSDWNTKARFTDVPTNHKDQELVKYAALVADEGVFGGAAGKLMAGNNITRQQMAKVLNGAYAAVNGESLIEIAEGVDNVRIPDLASARAEFEDAIQALMDLEISSTNSGNFRPLENVTRAQFSKFLYNTINFEAVDVAPFEVKAVNSTTVEVIFDQDIENIDKVKFAIEGLDIKGAVVKQTSKRTAVLTTSEQKGGTEYTVTVDGEKAGTFVGIAAVVPTAIKLNTQSVQGVIGEEVTLTAAVTVPEGQSKEGVSVTFNVTNSSNNNEKLEVEAFTNAEGVATYKYTRYYASEDTVTAYATKKSTVYSAGKVYWANAKQLTIKDVTGVNNLANNESKVYEINSANNANKYVFVTFKENLNVTADKVVRTVGAQGSSTYVLNQNNTISSVASDYPYEISTGAKAVIAVKLDANGKANLVLTGTNATVTPVVYEGVAVDGTDTGNIAGDQLSEFSNASYSATALQASAPTVSFEAKHSLGLTIEAAGVANAATYKSTTETGGRDYTVTYVDKNGKPAAANTVVQVAIPVQTASNGVFLIDADGNQVTGTRQGEYRVFNVTVKGTEGKAKFTVGSTSVTQYVEPIAFIDNGTGIGAKAGLDTTDLQAKGAATHFTDAVTYSTSLKLVDANDKEIKSVYTGEAAYFLYETVDQNGKPRAYRLADGTTASTTLTYSVTAGTSPLVVQGRTIAAGDSATFNAVVAAGSNKGRLAVTATAGTTASVYATATVGGLVLGTTDTVTATFTSTSVVNVNGKVTAVDKTNNIVSINGVPYALAGATYLNQGTVVPTLSAFYDHLTVGKDVSVTKDADGKLVFNIVPPVSNALVSKAEVTGNNEIQVTFSGAVNASPTASQFAIDFNGNGTIETNEYATVASGSGSVLTLTFASVHNLSTSTVSVPDLKYTPTVAGTLLSVASTNITAGFTTPVTVASAAHGVTIAGSTAPTAGAAAVALNNVLTVPVGSVTAAGNIIVTLKADKAGVTSAIEVPVAVSLLDNEKVVASKIATELNKLGAVTDKFTITATDNKVTVKAKAVDAADVAANLAVGIADPDIAVTPTFTAVFNGLTNGTATNGTTTPGSVDAYAKTNAKFTAVTGTGTVKPLTVKVLSTNGSTLVDTSVTVAVAAGDSAATVASKVKTALEANNVITSNYTVSISTDEVTLTNKVAEAVTTTITAE